MFSVEILNLQMIKYYSRFITILYLTMQLSNTRNSSTCFHLIYARKKVRPQWTKNQFESLFTKYFSKFKLIILLQKWLDHSIEPTSPVILTPKSQFSSLSTPLTVTINAKERNKQSLCFYQLLLISSQYNDPLSKKQEIVLGTLREEFLNAINATTKNEGSRIFTIAFNTYCTTRSNSEIFWMLRLVSLI